MDLYKVFEKQLLSKNFAENDCKLAAVFATKDGSVIEIIRVSTDDFPFIDENYDIEKITTSGIPKFISIKDEFRSSLEGGKNDRKL
jgi:hypothetical protein